MRNITVQGIILKKRNIGEHDQFLTIYSPDIGYIEARAKGARKINSSFTGHVDVLNICQFELYKSSYSYTLVQCQATEPFKKIRKSLEMSALAFLILELFEKTAQKDEESSQKLFNLLTKTLRTINSENSILIIEAFKCKTLNLAGAIPDVSECSSCHQRWSSQSTITADHEGHLFCQKCKPQNTQLTEIPFNQIKLINFIINSDYNEVCKISLKPAETDQLKILSNRFLYNYIHSDIKTEKILHELTRDIPATQEQAPADTHVARS